MLTYEKRAGLELCIAVVKRSEQKTGDGPAASGARTQANCRCERRLIELS
jgi:hypothetical protein